MVRNRSLNASLDYVQRFRDCVLLFSGGETQTADCETHRAVVGQMLMYRCGGVVGVGTSYARSRVPPLCNSLNGCYFRLLPLLSPSSSPPPPITVGSS